MEFDNDRDHNSYQIDVGRIIDGTVEFNEQLNRYIIVDEDKVGFDPQVALSTLNGKRIRMTMISFESLNEIEEIVRISSISSG